MAIRRTEALLGGAGVIAFLIPLGIGNNTSSTLSISLLVLSCGLFLLAARKSSLWWRVATIFPAFYLFLILTNAH